VLEQLRECVTLFDEQRVILESWDGGDEDGASEGARSSTGLGEAAAVPSAERPHWGHLRVLDRIARGAFGTVYRAWDPRLQREVALKLLHPLETAAPLTRGAVAEGRLLASASHRHVVAVYGADRIDGRVGIWMEFIHGRTLAISSNRKVR
jgi:serine/threonine protein kinase